MPNVSIKKCVYSMAQINGQDAELVLYGDIVEQQPTNWWGEPVEGQYILLTEFLEDLAKITGCKTLTIRINSYGGDAGVSNLIHNRLREMSRKGTSLSCVIDGVAMSGGSLIMCACDSVRVNPSSLIMIHKCWQSLYGAYNADELREQAKQQDAWDKMQVEIYKRKTGLSDAVIMHMMSDTATMTGREAVEKGFADELIEDAQPLAIAASADGRTLFVQGKAFPLCPGIFAPDAIPTVKPDAKASDKTNTIQPVVTGGQGGNSMTEQELRAQYPDIVAQIEASARATVDTTAAVNSAVQAEQTRMKEIDAIAGLFDESLVAEARYGEKKCDAKELAFRAAQKASKSGAAFMADANADAKDSGAANVPAATAETGEAEEPKTEEQKIAVARAAVKSVLHPKEA